MSSSNRPSKRQSRVKARSARRPATTARRRASSGRKPAAASRPAAKKVQRAGTVAEPAAKPTGPAPPSSRLTGSSRSRLTINPGQPPVSRAPLELSKKPRPSDPRPLSQVELDEDEVLIDAFDATLDGVKVRITAVLERTCVYVDMDGDRRLARKDNVWVQADRLPIRRRTTG